MNSIVMIGWTATLVRSGGVELGYGVLNVATVFQGRCFPTGVVLVIRAPHFGLPTSAHPFFAAFRSSVFSTLFPRAGPFS